jgi:hypothetical protein
MTASWSVKDVNHGNTYVLGQTERGDGMQGIGGASRKIDPDESMTIESRRNSVDLQNRAPTCTNRQLGRSRAERKRVLARLLLPEGYCLGGIS